MRGGEVVSRRSHKPKVAGSSPARAIIIFLKSPSFGGVGEAIMETRFIIEQLAAAKLGYSLPPYLPVQFNQPQVAAIKKADDMTLLKIIAGEQQGDTTKLPRQHTAMAVQQVFPLRLQKTGDREYWQMPYEPILSVKGRNVIVKRNVSKGRGRGTIKEHWTQDDYTLEITGVLFTLDGKYPTDDVKRLREYCEAPEALKVLCPLYEVFDIARIVIEDYDFPHTKGENIQAFNIRATSDDITQLLIDDNLTVL